MAAQLYEGMDLPYPTSETVQLFTPIQEQGPESIRCILRLYDISTSPWRLGSYILRCMPEILANEITEAMAITNLNAHPKGFINIGPQCYSWNVALIDHLDVQVEMLGNILNNHISYTSKKRITRAEILSQPQSRLPNDCASVEFSLHSGSETTCEGRFRVHVTTDDIETKSRDYNVMNHEMFCEKVTGPILSEKRLVKASYNKNDVTFDVITDPLKMTSHDYLSKRRNKICTWLARCST